MTRIEVRESSIHHKGVFALEPIKKGTKVIEYVGEKISAEEYERRADDQLAKHKEDSKKVGGVYIFEIDENTYIDGATEYNTAKYINHSCSPNCEVDITDGRIWIVAERDINEGEELFYNYGYDFDDEFEEHPCKCGSDNCVGYILSEDDWPKLKEKKNQREKSE
jgi:hypothetical protein